MGYQHKKDRFVADGTIQHWRCVEGGCPARVHTNVADVGNDVQIHSFNEHNHIRDEELYPESKLKADLCAKAVMIHSLHCRLHIFHQ